MILFHCLNFAVMAMDYFAKKQLMKLNARVFNIMLFANICVLEMQKMRLDVGMLFFCGITIYNKTNGFHQLVMLAQQQF